MAQSVLVIDDDVTLNGLICEHLRTAGYLTAAAHSGPDGLQLAGQINPDLIVLDVMMPDMDGWEVCQKLRDKWPVPIIMLTAKGEEVDKLRGFHLGVDDYVTKPFSLAELTARIGAVLKRAAHRSAFSHRVESGDLIIDLDQRRVTANGQLVELSAKEYRLLEVLVRYVQRPVPTEMLLREVWGPEYVGEPDHAKHYIWLLRKKIEADPGDPKHIITEHGFGYRFE